MTISLYSVLSSYGTQRKDDSGEQQEEDTGACRHLAIAQIAFAAA